MHKRQDWPVNIVSRFEKSNDLKFWLSKSPEERIEAVEFLETNIMPWPAIKAPQDLSLI